MQQFDKYSECYSMTRMLARKTSAISVCIYLSIDGDARTNVANVCSSSFTIKLIYFRS